MCVPMSAITKPQQLRLRITDEDGFLLKRLAGTSLTQNDVATVLLEAAIRAVRSNGDAYQVPLRFRIGDDPHVKASPVPKSKAS